VSATDEQHSVYEETAEERSDQALAGPGLVPMVHRLLRNPLYIGYLLFKAPAAVAFEVPNTILLYCKRDLPPAAPLAFSD
jgi:hypothetical protein